jgi:hypothetical protein
MSIIKLNKTEVNELLYHLCKDNHRYGLVLKLVYVYGRNIGDVLRLRKRDINISNNIICFKLYDGSYNLPIHKDVKKELLDYIAPLDDKDYLFINVANDIEVNNTNVYSNRINGYLRDLIKQLNKGNVFGGHCPLLVCTDFKILRGQHLIIDGCPLKIVQELYHIKNVASIKNMIRYKDLLKLCFECDSLDKVFNSFTDLNVFYDYDFVEMDLFTLFKNGCSVIIEYDSLLEDFNIVVGDDDLFVEVSGLDVGVFRELLGLSSGEYKFVDGFKIVKN